MRAAPLLILVLLLAGCAQTAAPTPTTSTTPSPSPSAPSSDQLQNLGVASFAPGDITPFGQDDAPWLVVRVIAGEAVIAPVAGRFDGYWQDGANLTPAGGAYRVMLLGVGAGALAPGADVAAGDALGQACAYAETPWHLDQQGPQGQDPRAEVQARIAALPACGATPYTVPPFPPEEMTGIIPLGNLAPPEHTIPSDHVYLLYPRNATGFGAVDVRAPGDLYVYDVGEQLAVRDGVPNDDFSIDFAACREVTGWFGHVSSLVGALKAAFDDATAAEPGACMDYADPPGNATFHACHATLDPHVAADDLLGTGGGKASAALDLGTKDSRAPAPTGMASPRRYPPDEATIVCPLDLFAQPGRDALYAKLGNGDPRTQEPRCGTPFADVNGTLAGAWFTPDVAPDDALGPDARTRSLELAPDAVDGVTGVLALGGPGAPERLASAPQHAGSVDRAFAEVAPASGVTCYQSGGAPSFLVALDDATHLRLARRDGACGTGPWTMPADAQAYVR